MLHLNGCHFLSNHPEVKSVKREEIDSDRDIHANLMWLIWMYLDWPILLHPLWWVWDHDHPKFRTATLVYKSVNGRTPIYMASMFQKVANVFTRKTRFCQSNRLYVPRRDLCVSRRALCYNGTILYNTLNSKTQECELLCTFKYKAFKVNQILMCFYSFNLHTLYIPLYICTPFSKQGPGYHRCVTMYL